MPTATIIDGRKLAASIRSDAAGGLAILAQQQHAVRLDALLIGDPDAGRIYAAAQEKRCRKLGIDYKLHTLAHDASDEQVQQCVERLSRDPAVTGIMINLPLPEHLDTPAAQYAIDPYKDVEGVNPANIGLLFYGTPIIAPCTALAVLTIIKQRDIELRGKNVVVVGQGSIVGKPIALGLMGEEATVTTCNKYTPDLACVTRQADILVAAAGVPELIGESHVKPGATVIDVGINTVPGESGDGSTRMVGDVRFDEVKNVAGAITPVPGGVGPVTVAILLHNTVEAAAKQLAARRIH